MYILHQYHKVSGLKAMHSDVSKWEKMLYVIYTKLIQNGGGHIFLREGGGGRSSVVKEYEIIMLKYNGKAWAYIYYSFVHPRI